MKKYFRTAAIGVFGPLSLSFSALANDVDCGGASVSHLLESGYTHFSHYGVGMTVYKVEDDNLIAETCELTQASMGEKIKIMQAWGAHENDTMVPALKGVETDKFFTDGDNVYIIGPDTPQNQPEVKP